MNTEDRNLKNLFAQTPEMFCLLKGPEHVFEYVNQAHIKVLGFDATGKSVREAQPESVEVHGILDNVFRTGETAHLNEIAVTVTDRLRYFNLTYAAKRDSTGKVDGIMILGSEITDQVLAAKAVEQARVELRSFFEQAPAAMYMVKGPEFEYGLVNPHYQEIVGRKASELIGRKTKEIFSEKEIEAFYPIAEEVYRTGKPFIGYEVPYNRLDQQQRYLNIVYQAYRDEKNTIIGLLGFAHDVTEQVLTRRRLEESFEELRTLRETVPQIVWSANALGTMVFANSRWTEYSGSSNPEKWMQFVHPDDVNNARINWARSVESGEPFESEIRLRRHDGVYRHFLVRAYPYRDRENKIIRWYGTSTDVEENRLFVQELEREREARDQFVALLTHDLRNPLSAAKLSAQSILRQPDSPDKVSKLSSRIIDSINRVNKMIEDMLDYDKIKAGRKLSLNLEDVNLVSLVEEVINELETIHGDRFNLISSHPSVTGHWSSEGLRRAIENLCVNAVKYGDPIAKITVKVESSEKAVLIKVHNSGPTIPPENLKKLFDPFERQQSSRDIKGWGLGLTVVKGVAEAHGGEAFAESDSLKGTTFVISIPLKKD